MNISIRNHVIGNFKNLPKDEIKDSIVESIKEQDEITLPGFGVFFELLWKHSNNEIKDEILSILKDAIEKESR